MATKQTTYNKKWQNENKERANYLKDRTAARRFLRKMAAEDIEEMEQLIEQRKKALRDEGIDPDN